MDFHKTITAVLFLVLFGFFGCQAFIPNHAMGNKFKPQRVSQLVKGSSTMTDVHNLFGDPLERSATDLFRAKWWRYRYGYLGILGVEIAELEVYFKGNLVEDYQLSVSRNRY